MTGVDTIDIVKNVRCEMKEAVELLPPNHSINNSFVAYTFTFTSIEDNGVDGAADFTVPIANGFFRIGFDAGTERHREGINTISVSEQIANTRKLDCSDVKRTASHRYPILGRVGIADDVARNASLLDEKNLKVGPFNQEFFFTVAYVGGIHPSVSIIPASGHSRNFRLNATAGREDRHKLLLTITTPPRPLPPTQVELVNIEDFPVAGPGQPSGREFAPQRGVAPARRAPSAVEDGRTNALRQQENQRSLRFEEQILERLPR